MAPASILPAAPAAPATPVAPDLPSDRAVLRMGWVLILGAVLAILDSTIVNVGLNSAASELNSSLATMQWVATGYLLAVSLVMPLSGWVVERFGGRRMWLISVALFVAGSVLCGLAWSAPSLIVFRVLQGIGGGMTQPIGQAIFARAAGPRLARLIGVVTLPATLAPVLGPILGGVVVQGLDWRWMFLLNLPLGILTLVLAARVLPTDTAISTTSRLDVRGLALLSPAVALLVYGFAAAGNNGGFAAAGTIAPLALGAMLLLGYVGHALRTTNPPLIDIRLFARRGFAVATGNSFLLGASVYSAMLLLPLYYEQVTHAGALRTGLLLAPQALGTAATALLAGRLGRHFGPRTLMLTGIGLALVSTVPFTQLAAHPAGWLLTTALVVRGIGLGLTMGPGMATVYASVPRDAVPRAAGALNVLNRIGGSIGTAVLVVVLQHGLAAQAPAAAFGQVFWWALGLAALSLVQAVLFPRHAN